MGKLIWLYFMETAGSWRPCFPFNHPPTTNKEPVALCNHRHLAAILNPRKQEEKRLARRLLEASFFSILTALAEIAHLQFVQPSVVPFHLFTYYLLVLMATIINNERSTFQNTVKPHTVRHGTAAAAWNPSLATHWVPLSYNPWVIYL